MEAFLEELRREIKTAVQSVLHAKVDYLTMGMSAETFWGGSAGAEEFVKFMGELSGGLGISKYCYTFRNLSHEKITTC